MWSSQKKFLIPPRYLLCSAINFQQHSPHSLNNSVKHIEKNKEVLSIYSVTILLRFASASHPEDHSPALFQQHHVSV